MIVITATAGVVLIAGGTAGAASISSTPSDAEQAANDMAAPKAETAEATAPDSATPNAKQQKKTRKQRDQLSKDTAQSANATAAGKKERDNNEQEHDTQSEDSDSSAESPTGKRGSCEASMYSESQPTASGEQFDPSAMTAAHKSLPMDTKVKVTNPSNNKSVTVRINDRGPYVDGRCLDLSTASFKKIASENAGVTDVEWQVVK